MKSLDKLLLKILCASVLLFIISLIFSPQKRTAPKSVESAILNPKYKNAIKKIEITAQNEAEKSETIVISKYDSFFLVSKKDSQSVAIADSKLVSSFIEKSIKTRNMYKIIDKKDARTTDSCNISVFFFGNDDNLYTKVYFLGENILTSRITVRSNSSNSVFETEDDFHQFLTTDMNYWSEARIFCEAENPTKIIFEDFSSETGSPQKITLDETSENFTSVLDSLLPLRHGKMLDGEPNSRAKKISAITLHDGTGRILKVDFFERSENSAASEPETSYFYKKSVLPSPADSQENAFAFYSENAVYELSLWTYEKMRAGKR